MSTKYSKSEQVPTEVLINRLDELSDACIDKISFNREFTMRIPAELDRDPDLVLSISSQRLKQQGERIKELEKKCKLSAHKLADTNRRIEGLEQGLNFSRKAHIRLAADEAKSRKKIKELEAQVSKFIDFTFKHNKSGETKIITLGLDVIQRLIEDDLIDRLEDGCDCIDSYCDCVYYLEGFELQPPQGVSDE